MPRRLRIDMVGYYHIVNRGVEQRIVYKTVISLTKFKDRVEGYFGNKRS